MDKRNQMIITHWIRVILNKDFILDLMLLIVEFTKLFEKFDSQLSNRKLTIENDGFIMRSTRSGYNWFTAIGTVIATPGCIYTWRIKLLKGENIVVGVIANEHVKTHKSFWWLDFVDDECEGYALYTRSKFHPGGIVYGQNYNEGDTINMCLDLKNNELTYGRNKIDYGVAPIESFVNKEYRLAIAVIGTQAPNAVEIISLNISS